ncbi:MAG: hypothetical protein IH886_16985, partial [Nitrospinae bacterium]|nr:hypothetical protein [Nitrospinota bacterium]
FLLKSGEAEEALAGFNRAVELEPLNPYFHHQLGMFYMKNTDRPDLGRFHLGRSLQLDPDQPSAGEIFSLLGSSP